MTTSSIEAGEGGYGWYVYGIVGDVNINIPPVEVLCNESMDLTWPVYALSYRAIRAIVSKVSLREFGQEALETNVRDLQWLKAKVCVHESVIETVSEYCTLVPMKFCAIFLSESRVLEMLALHYDDFVDALERLEGSTEWGVKIYRDDEVLAGQVEKVSDSARKLAVEMAEKSSGAAYIWKKRLEGVVAAEMAQISDECAQSSHDRLSIHAEEAGSNPLLSTDITGNKGEMILNGVYLVSEERVEAFQAELADLRGKYDRLGFSYMESGPWPPYNFVTGGIAEGSPRG